MKSVPPGALILVPWVKADPVPCQDGEVTIKRTSFLHPSLPAHEVVQIAAQGCSDQQKFVLKSPLDGKVKSDAKAPAPFWCVLAVPEASEANMAYRECRFEVGAPAVSIQGKRKNETNEAGKTKMVSTFRILMNVQKLEQGQVLTVGPDEKKEGGKEGGPTEAAPAAKRRKA